MCKARTVTPSLLRAPGIPMLHLFLPSRRSRGPLPMRCRKTNGRCLIAWYEICTAARRVKLELYCRISVAVLIHLHSSITTGKIAREVLSTVLPVLLDLGCIRQSPNLPCHDMAILFLDGCVQIELGWEDGGFLGSIMHQKPSCYDRLPRPSRCFYPRWGGIFNP